MEAGQTPPRAILSFYSPTDITAEDRRTVKELSGRWLELTILQITASMAASEMPKAGERGRNRETDFDCLCQANL